MDILQEIIAYKRQIVSVESEHRAMADFEKSACFEIPVYSLKNDLLARNGYGIIAEFKRKSPSKGMINETSKVENVVSGYQNVGASAVSVLTDEKYFGGSSNDFQVARDNLQIPLLRKDFIVDTYQVYQTKAMGADLMLLIAAALSEKEQLHLSKAAKSIGLEVLLEIHSKEEIVEDVLEYVDVIGVNNRNLKTFKTSIENSIELAEVIPGSLVKISESGISSIEDIKKLSAVGYNGFLIGEQFMRHEQPDSELKRFLES